MVVWCIYLMIIDKIFCKSSKFIAKLRELTDINKLKCFPLKINATCNNIIAVK